MAEQPMRYIALQRIKVGDRWASPGDAVPELADTPGLAYELAVRRVAEVPAESSPALRADLDALAQRVAALEAAQASDSAPVSAEAPTGHGQRGRTATPGKESPMSDELNMSGLDSQVPADVSPEDLEAEARHRRSGGKHLTRKDIPESMAADDLDALARHRRSRGHRGGAAPKA